MKMQLRERGAFRRKSVAVAIVGLMLGGAGATIGATAASAGVRPQGIVSTAQAEVFVSVSPTRILDTRGAPLYTPIGVPTAKKLGQGETIDLKIAGGANGLVPVGATAAVLNTTIDIDATKTSYITVYPKGEARPSASTNNPIPGMVTANATIAKLGQDGAVSVYNLYGETNVVFDLVGYLIPLNQVTGFENINNTGGTVNSGSGAPTGTTPGADGDYYIDITTNQLYGPRTGGSYPALPTTLTKSAISTFNDTDVAIAALGSVDVSFPVANDTRPPGNQGTIVHTNATPTQFTLAKGTYRVDYRATVGASVLPVANTASAHLELNGAQVGSDNDVLGLVGVGASLSDTVFVTVPTAGGTLTLTTDSALAVNLGSASITIEQIA